MKGHRIKCPRIVNSRIHQLLYIITIFSRLARHHRQLLSSVQSVQCIGINVFLFYSVPPIVFVTVMHIRVQKKLKSEK